MFLFGLVEGSALFAVAMALAGIPLWLVMAAITYGVDKRSKRLARRGLPASEAVGPRATRFGPPAKVAALALVGLPVLLAAFSAVEWLFLRRVQLPEAAGWVLALSCGLGVILVLALGVVMVAIVIDMLAAHRIAGRDTKIAYCIVGGAVRAPDRALRRARPESGAQML